MKKIINYTSLASTVKIPKNSTQSDPDFLSIKNQRAGIFRVSSEQISVKNEQFPGHKCSIFHVASS